MSVRFILSSFPCQTIHSHQEILLYIQSTTSTNTPWTTTTRYLRNYFVPQLKEIRPLIRLIAEISSVELENSHILRVQQHQCFYDKYHPISFTMQRWNGHVDAHTCFRRLDSKPITSITTITSPSAITAWSLISRNIQQH